MRTEGDTWDIVSSVGMTALQVAAARAIETGRPDALIQDDYAALFVEAAGDQATIALVRDPQRWTGTPLMDGYIGLRSKFFDDLFLSAGRSGVRQAVILAAGLDARAYRLDWPQGTTVFEIDQPQVLDFKRQVLSEAGAVPRADRREVSIDLRDDWPAALIAAGFDPAIPTVWSAEGLLPYLPGAAQDALFHRIDELSAPSSSLATDTFDNSVDLRQVSDYQAEHLRDTPYDKVDFSTLFYTDARADTAGWLTAQGWTTSTLRPDELPSIYHRPMPELPTPFNQLTAAIQYLTAHKPA
ncbi:SAM-dependent methyltransferase [Nocardia brasiliensis]|uniref:S-adenosyl-L-methionine-dependent methyltransferase n=1 Tax=Nocardia brasiliensis TaxID=37326 RepID=A0A6G9XQJ7_NOCBR|nr:class I SAM-dependent methyltransferase [Nocardia brasiliensis]QIS03120.1 SAM-dependent methyltransferase [Nocardia brasiliensis]